MGRSGCETRSKRHVRAGQADRSSVPSGSIGHASDGPDQWRFRRPPLPLRLVRLVRLGVSTLRRGSRRRAPPRPPQQHSRRGMPDGRDRWMPSWFPTASIADAPAHPAPRSATTGHASPRHTGTSRVPPPGCVAGFRRRHSTAPPRTALDPPTRSVRAVATIAADAPGPRAIGPVAPTDSGPACERGSEP